MSRVVDEGASEAWLEIGVYSVCKWKKMKKCNKGFVGVLIVWFRMKSCFIKSWKKMRKCERKYKFLRMKML